MEKNGNLDVLILAAGMGTRMRSNLAKVLHQLDGRPLIDHVCQTANSLGPRRIIVVIGHQADEVKAAVVTDNTEFAIQREMLGTGDAVNAAKEMLAGSEGTLLVLSGDVPMMRSETLESIVDQHSSTDAACTIVSVNLYDPSGYGRVVRDADGGFQRIVEQKDASEAEKQVREINSGIYCFDTRKLFDALGKVKNNNAQGEYYLTDVPRILSEDGEKIGIFLHNDESEIEGVNDRRQLASMEAELRRRTIERLTLESGVTFIDPNNAYVSGRTSIGRDTVVYPNVTIEGESSVGEGCVLGPGTRIVNSTIGNGVEIRDNCFITDSVVGDKCTIGPMAHMRGHAVLMESSKIGNFVELKKTTLGRGSKASHLTYLGDATIGEKTNIGAGTITCNYDGKNKHETHIGDNVKIGSDTMLIAPITVGDGAVTGAGSVVNKDVEKNKLVVGAPARAIKTVTGDK